MRCARLKTTAGTPLAVNPALVLRVAPCQTLAEGPPRCRLVFANGEEEWIEGSLDAVQEELEQPTPRQVPAWECYGIVGADSGGEHLLDLYTSEDQASDELASVPNGDRIVRLWARED